MPRPSSWKTGNKEYVRLRSRLWYLQNKTRHLRQSREWALKHPDRISAIKRKSDSDPRRKARAKLWRKLNADLIQKSRDKWNAANGERCSETRALANKAWYARQISGLTDKYLKRALRITGRTVTDESLERIRAEIAAKRFRRTAKYFAAARLITAKEPNGTD